MTGPADKPSQMSAQQARGTAIVVLVMSTLLLTYGLGDRSFMSEEVRWGVIGREMSRHGDWFHPTFNGQLYFDKPLASYWLIVATGCMTGRIDEWTARFPSVLSGILSVLLVGWLGRRCYDERTAIAAMAIFATCLGTVVYARRACADMENLTGILAAIALTMRFQERSGKQWILMLWLIMGVTSSMKGLLGFVVPLWVLSTLSTVEWWRNRQSNESDRKSLSDYFDWFFSSWSILAIPLGIGIFVAPYYFAMSQSGASGVELLFRENLQRFIAPHNHRGPVTIYLQALFVLAAPWSVFLPALAFARGPVMSTPSHRLVRCYFWAVLGFFCLSASRRSYYLLPVLPPLSLLMARVLIQPWERWGKWSRVLGRSGLYVAAVALIGLGIILLLPRGLMPSPLCHFPESDFDIMIGIGAFLLASGMVYSARWCPSPLPLVLCVFVVIQSVVFVGVLPRWETQRTRREFAAEIRRIVPEPERTLALFRARDIVFDLNPGAPLHDYQSQDEWNQQPPAQRPAWIIVRRRYRSQLDQCGTIVLQEREHPWDGVEQLGDKMELIQVHQTPVAFP